ncbi:MAG: hypothetical protein EBV45_12820, partial [Chloroflexi bacterium]|nr:hypothetical protein [Chloroflexota bacterium]
MPCWELWVEESKLLINHHGIEVADPQQRATGEREDQLGIGAEKFGVAMVV